jgi:indole-3-glycerol phosphate synthase/phosphoribosylanthranilate isomerase
MATCRESHGWRKRPWVKICGITRVEDARLAAGLGADLLGFVFAPSPRRADARILRELDGLEALKVGVVVTRRVAGRPVPESGVLELLAEGLLDAVQLHGDERPEECPGLGYPYYKALPVGSLDDVDACGRYLCPRVLADAWSGQARGGTGRPIREDLVDALRARGPLWVAGGIGPDNVGRLIRRFHPELLDASSRLEAAPGVKDPRLLARFFGEIEAACEDAAREGERE